MDNNLLQDQRITPKSIHKIMKSTRCSACKFMRKKCPPDCIFSPYFPSDDPQRYACVHKIYGASNVARMLQDLPVHLRGEAADAMYIEARCRVEDPVYGCVKILSQLQDEIHAVMTELAKTQAEITFLVASMGHGSGFEPSFDCSSGRF